MKKLALLLIVLVAMLIVDHIGATVQGNAKKTSIAEIVILLDRSGSMVDMECEMEKALHKFLKTQKKISKNILCTLIMFDDRYEIEYKQQPLSQIGKIDIQPRGRTALLDALGKATIDTAMHSRSDKVVFVIITDGLENESRRFNRAGVSASIDYLEERYGWQFMYLGANQDSFTEAQSYGIDMSWDYDSITLTSAVDSAATVVSSYIVDANDIIH